MAPMASSDGTTETEGASSNTLGSILKSNKEQEDGSEKKSVGFKSVRVIQHSVRLGDNPSVSQGLPIRLGNKKFSERFGSVDEFENSHEHHKARKLTKEERDALVIGKHTRSSMVSARKEVINIKHSRLDAKSDKISMNVEDDDYGSSGKKAAKGRHHHGFHLPKVFHRRHHHDGPKK